MKYKHGNDTDPRKYNKLEQHHHQAQEGWTVASTNEYDAGTLTGYERNFTVMGSAESMADI